MKTTHLRLRKYHMPGDNRPYVRINGKLYPEDEVCHMELDMYYDYNIDRSKVEVYDCYIDRMAQHNPDKFKTASAKYRISAYNSVTGRTLDDVQNFVSYYYDEPCKVIEICESKDYSGYYYTHIKYIKEV